MNKFDEIDKKILNILQENGRITNADLAAKVGLSPPPMLERVKKLEKNGVITKYVALLDPTKIDKSTIVFVSLTLARHRIKSIELVKEEMKKFPEVLECYSITGEEDYLLKVIVKDVSEYEKFMHHKLAKIPAVSRIKSFVVLSTSKYETKTLIE
ncbi:MAG: Lrp/AsnC family transcriptional regulator [Bacteroidales bacterium]|nr:Lrp/AsnC family transcriptional regulator [Bacteroidales bacterium]